MMGMLPIFYNDSFNRTGTFIMLLISITITSLYNKAQDLVCLELPLTGNSKY